MTTQLLSGDLKIATECCIIYRDQVLIQRRPKDCANFPNFITFPGGHVDSDEDLLSAVIREVNEESGIDLTHTNIHLKVSCINNHIDKDQIWIAFAFIAKLKKKQAIISSDEGLCEWMNIKDLIKSKEVFPPIKLYLDYILSKEKKVLYLSGQWEKAMLKKLTSSSLKNTCNIL